TGWKALRAFYTYTHYTRLGPPKSMVLRKKEKKSCELLQDQQCAVTKAARNPEEDGPISNSSAGKYGETPKTRKLLLFLDLRR
ncbi:MAG TPA: hypothetical protein VMV81_05710, partial [Phycisphaerae bacterium]|nr:hypothetical protein [Phycisphaerae bacterium]